MEDGITYQYVAVTSNGVLSPVVKTAPVLPPLIKIDQTIPVGYPSNSRPTANGDQQTSPNSANGRRMSSSADPTSPPQPQYRPTIINLAAPPPSVVTSPESSPSCPTTITTLTPLDSPSISPKPLVDPVDSDRPERMRDWLVRMINSGQFPGLRWLDKEKVIFRVPWIHAKKRDYNQERDAALFREWAIHSGKYGDGSDVTTWKINFRCALNGLKDIIERRELEEPDCRVYQMLPPSGTSRRRKRRRPYYPSEYGAFPSPDRDVRARLELTSPVTTPTLPSVTMATMTALTPSSAGTPIQVLPIVPAGTPIVPAGTPVRFPFVASPTTPHSATPIGVIQKLKHVVNPTSLLAGLSNHELVSERNMAAARERIRSSSSQPPTPRTPISPAAQFSPKVVSPSLSSSPINPQYFNSTSSRSTSRGPALPSMWEVEMAAVQGCSDDRGVLTEAFGIVPTIPMHPVLRTGPVYFPPFEFLNDPNAVTIRIMYGSLTIHMETLDCSQGTRIYYGPLHCRDVLPPDKEEALFGPLDAHQIALTPRHPASLAKQLFHNIKRGLIVEVENECVYATALCRAVVYHGSSPLKHTASLPKEERTKVFNYQHRFLPSLKYNTDGRGQPPKPYILFSMGQPWGAERPLSRNLVTVVVTYCKALNDLKVNNIPIYDELLFEAQEAKDIRIISPTSGDIEAEQFLNPGGKEPVTPS